MRRVFFVGWLFAVQAWAQAVVAVVDAQGVSDAAPSRAQKAGEAALAALTSWDVSLGPAYKKGAPRKCTGDDCAPQLASKLGALALLLELKGAEPAKGEKGPSDKLTVELSLWASGEELGRRKVDTTLDGLEAALRGPVDALLPTYARRGFGALVLPDDGSVTVKVGGRVLKGAPGGLVGVPAGTHAVDVVFANDTAVLRRVDVPEGGRVRVDTTPPPKPTVQTQALGGRFSVLRGSSYAVFMAGALTLASGLLVGALARSTVAPYAPCVSGSDQCATLDEVNLARAQADGLTTTGNVLLGVGYGFLGLGVGLFVLDVALER